ncbi:MAG: tRNA preQ1(34) S-adenosylmethionine ribosyltransferase-isomerase QueA [Chloroflexota bacterium]|nr:tRNA preQ1(34) S-adenosylmethionine ribosyltransferase-isomerase QueA [Chloroflexota bacterium]
MTESQSAAPGQLRTADFDYDLPPELIAQTPLDRRDASRLLVLDRVSGEMTHAAFSDLPAFLNPGDLLVANNSRVIPARLYGQREATGGSVELLLLRQEGTEWSALARPARKLKPGERLVFPGRSPGVAAAVVDVITQRGEGEITVRFEGGTDSRLDDYGVAPLPPYITERLDDAERYQTVYASQAGSAAAPTAGLHFTQELVTRLRALGVGWAEVTLHVGLDTFRPIAVENVEEHHIHQEWCEVSQATADEIAACRLRGKRVVAVGTTAARTLETLGRTWSDDDPRGISGMTGEFIVPGHDWKMVDALLTNFHLPRSTLLMLVSALAGRDAILTAYAEAVKRQYRFFSFGDAMLIR